MERPDGGSLTGTNHDIVSKSPAPPDADVCGPSVVCRLHERERDHRRAGDATPVLTLQPWTPRGAAATYIAWTVDDCSGHFGVFDAARERLLLGEGAPAGRRWRPVVETGPASQYLADATPDLRPSVPRARATAVDSPRLVPKPADAAEAGETRVFSLTSWTRAVTAYVQPWRPLNGGAVYLACRIDDPHERFSYHGWFGTLVDGVIRLGRRPAPAFVAIDVDDDGLAADAASLVPSGTAERTVSEVLAVHRGTDDASEGQM